MENTEEMINKKRYRNLIYVSLEFWKEGRENGGEAIFEEIKGENFPELMK